MKKRILAITSGGGHWIEMLRIRPAFEGCEVAFASVFPDYSNDVEGHRFYTITNFSRFNIVPLFKLIPEVFFILLKERPHVVITTGAAPPLVALAIAGLFFRSKTIWIDSIANVEHLSTSGRLARYVADIWLTQWAHLATAEGPQHWGAVV